MPFRYILVISLIIVSPLMAAEGDGLQCKFLPNLFDIYLRHHYAFHQLSDQLKTRTAEQYVKRLDPSKSMLLESDVAKLQKDLVNTFTTSINGECKDLDESEKLLISRAKENQEFVKEFLGEKYKLDESIEIQLDPQKRGYSKTLDERKETLKKLIHFQISNYLLADMKLPEAKKQLLHRYELVTKRLSDGKFTEVLNGWAEAFALALDPHSSYLSKDDLEDFQIQMQLSLEGIGASLTTQDGFTVIDSLIPGGGAERSKALRPQDKIIAVSQETGKPQSVIDMDLRDVVKLIRGKKGTKVKLTILRQQPKSETFEVTIVRDKIDIKEQAAKITYETRKVGAKTLTIAILDLPSFYGGGGKGTRWSSSDTKALLDEARKKKVDGLVLNLSKNGGGLLEEAVKISGLFLQRGSVVATKDTDTKVSVLADEDSETSWAGPMVILTSRFSASASEILAGALHDYKRAVIVGADHTFGKGSVQAVSGLPGELGGMKVTTGMFFLPGGESTQHAGVNADVRIPSPFNSEEVGESKLDYSLPPQSIKSFASSDADAAEQASHWVPIDDSTVKKLVEKSKERVDKNVKFNDIKKDIAESEKNKGVVKLSDLRKRIETENKNGKKKRNPNGTRDKKDKDIDEPVVQESIDIAVDLITSRQ